MVDGVATSVGALMGTSPVTTYIESAPGIEEVRKTHQPYIDAPLMYQRALSQLPPGVLRIS